MMPDGDREWKHCLLHTAISQLCSGERSPDEKGTLMNTVRLFRNLGMLVTLLSSIVQLPASIATCSGFEWQPAAFQQVPLPPRWTGSNLEALAPRPKAAQAQQG
jgi:hypothetical protein